VNKDSCWRKLTEFNGNTRLWDSNKTTAHK